LEWSDDVTGSCAHVLLGFVYNRRLATGNVQCVCSATYVLSCTIISRPPRGVSRKVLEYHLSNIFKIFLGYRSRTRTLTLNPNPNPITDHNCNRNRNRNPKKIKENKTTPE